MKKCILALFSFALASLFFYGAIWYLTDGFSLKVISSNYPFSSKWECSAPPKEEILGYLSQPFYYLGKGSQCYVFESEDKQIVLKFFRHSRYRLPQLARYILSPSFLTDIQNQKRELKHTKLDALFFSCTLAYNELNNESGLLYLHLNRTFDLKKTVTIYDKLKRSYTLNIDDYTFIIQKHGEQTLPHLDRLLRSGLRKEAEENLASLLSILDKRLRKGICDRDAIIHKNSGFHNNQAFFIDVGAFTKEPIPDRYRELCETTAELLSWLREKDAQLAENFEKMIKSYRVNRW